MGMYARLRQLQPGDLARLDDPSAAVELFHRDDEATLSLEKAWHGLDQLLTAVGEDPTLGFLLGAGTPTGADLGYGPPRVLSAEFVRRLAAALSTIDDDRFWAGYDPERFEEEGIYPGVWDEPPGELREEYLAYFRDLRAFVARVASAGGQIAIAIL